MVRFCLRCSKTSNNCPHGLINSREYLARSNFIILSPNLHMLLIIKSKNSRRSKFIVCKNINNSGLLSPVSLNIQFESCKKVVEFGLKRCLLLRSKLGSSEEPRPNYLESEV